MAAHSIDYDALAQQHGATSVDYDALATQHGAVSAPAQATQKPAESLGRDMFGEIPSNVVTRIGHRLKQNLNLPAQIGPAANAISEGIKNIRESGPSKMPEFIDALKQYKDPEKLAADLIAGYVMAGAPEINVPSAKPPAWWKSGEPAAESATSGAIPTALKIGKMIPGVSHYAHLADFAHKLLGATTEKPEAAVTAASPTPAYKGPTGPPELWGKSAPGEAPQPPAQAPKAPIASGAEPDIEMEARLGTTTPPEPPPIKGVGDKLGTPAEEAKFRESFVKRDTAKKALETGVKPPPNAVLPDTSPRAVEQQLNDALGGQPLKPGVPLKNQTTAVATKLPQGFTPVESSALKGYKYDPATREFESITQGGQHYIHGDVSPEEAQAFAKAESKGQAWQAIRKNPLVAKVVNGKRFATRPLKDLKDLINPQPESVSPDDLTGMLNESLKQLRDLNP